MSEDLSDPSIQKMFTQTYQAVRESAAPLAKRVVMNAVQDALAEATIENPFDRLKHTDEQGEYWLARDMWEPIGYSTWQAFEDLTKRAIKILDNKFAGQGHISVETKSSSMPNGGVRLVRDYRLTRYGAYMVLSRSDKPELADYFVMQTMFAENAQAGETSRLRGSMTDEARARAKQTKRVTAMRKAVAGEGPVDGEVQRQLLTMLQVPAEGDQLHPVLVALVRAHLTQETDKLLDGPTATEVRNLGEALRVAERNLSVMISIANGITGHLPLPILPTSGRGDDFVDPDPKDKGYACQ